MAFYVVVQNSIGNNEIATLERAKDIGVSGFDLADGIPLTGKFKANAVFPFDPEYKKGIKLVDLQQNLWGGFPVSPKLRYVFELEKKIEFLPIQIANHRGKIVATDYTLANFLTRLDCVNMAKSITCKDTFDPDRVDRIDKLVIDPSKVPDDCHAFRLLIRPRVVIVDDKIAKAVKAARLTGIGLISEKDFNSLNKFGV